MELQYLVREPENITPQTPVLFMIHGYGSNEEDLFSFLPTLPKDWLVVSFRAPRTSQFEGYSWYDIDFMDKDKFVDVPQATESLNALLNSIQDVKKRYALEGPMHLCGFSQGGILSYALSLTYPQFFSKVALLSCYPEDKLLTNIVKDKKKFQNLRFFVSHGVEDAVIPMEWAQRGAELLYDHNCYFSFRDYLSGHGVNQKNYMDLMDFFAK